MRVDLAELSEALWPKSRPIPAKQVTCRHCKRRNEIDIPTAVLEPDSVECGQCGDALLLGPDEPLIGLSPEAYQHPLDRKTLQAAMAVPGFGKAVRWILKHVTDRYFRLMFMSDAVRLNERQFPELVAVLEQACRRLDFGEAPTLYLQEKVFPNAMTSGEEDRFIAVWSGALDLMDDEEMLFIFGHELGHLHSQHMAYRLVAVLLGLAGVTIMGLGRFAVWPMMQALAKWSRCSELSADRAGLLTARDLPSALSSFLKLTGGARPGVASRTSLSLAEFVRQARELEKNSDEDLLDNVLSVHLTLDRSHPFAAWRVMHLLRWVEDGNYLDILAGQYPRSEAEPE